ncbi:MAG: nucleotidyltransferase domain-containing protein, partial [Saprospiraceae bacterium]
PDVTHIVYVDPVGYSELEDLAALQSVGRAVGRLNKILPKRRFILLGPGRWGSRGDIKLGVSVTYSDINNTSMLIEMAKQKGNYVPDLSFGTHFFQDLVEASIRYLPLYLDDESITFNQDFFDNSKNILPEILPEFKNLQNVLKVIDVQNSTNGKQMKVLMNAELDKAVAYLVRPATAIDFEVSEVKQSLTSNEDNWKWRRRMSEKIASLLDGERFGVKAFYVVGSTKNATAAPADDIDVIIHFEGTDEQRVQLLIWLEGWDLCLAEMNYIRTGTRAEKILDVKIVSTIEIEKKRGIAERIGSITDPAKRLPLKEK